MTNQEAIKILQEKISLCVTGEWKESVDAAISALQAQDLQSTCNQLATDTISRQAAIDALLEEVRLVDGYYVENDEVIDKDDAIEAIRLLPSAQPESNCLGCKHAGMWENEVEYGYPSPCTRCKRRANDNYEQ